MSKSICFECKYPVDQYDESVQIPFEEKMSFDIAEQQFPTPPVPKFRFYHKYCAPDSAVVSMIQKYADEIPLISVLLDMSKAENRTWRETLECLVIEFAKEEKKRRDAADENWIQRALALKAKLNDKDGEFVN